MWLINSFVILWPSDFHQRVEGRENTAAFFPTELKLGSSPPLPPAATM